jgi:hypothetical protein
MYRSGAKECVRTISHITSSRHHSGTLDQRNELLQKALTLYLTQVVDVKFKHKAQVALTALHDVKFGHMNGQFDRYNPLEHYRLTWLAPDGEWVEVDGENNIEFRQYTQSMPNQGDTSNGGEKNKEQIIHELRCTRGTGAHKRIDDFIGKAVAWYKAELQKQRDESRYLYVMNLTERYSISSTEKEDEPCKYKRYKLSDHKTFGSLFFPQKDALLSVLTDFEQRRGRFGKEGFPHKCASQDVPPHAAHTTTPGADVAYTATPGLTMHALPRTATHGADDVCLSRVSQARADAARAARDWQDESDQGDRALHGPAHRLSAALAHQNQSSAQLAVEQRRVGEQRPYAAVPCGLCHLLMLLACPWRPCQELMDVMFDQSFTVVNTQRTSEDDGPSQGPHKLATWSHEPAQPALG